jgi:hypothetical protein
MNYFRLNGVLKNGYLLSNLAGLGVAGDGAVNVAGFNGSPRRIGGAEEVQVSFGHGAKGALLGFAVLRRVIRWYAEVIPKKFFLV